MYVQKMFNIHAEEYQRYLFEGIDRLQLEIAIEKSQNKHLVITVITHLP